MATKTLNDWYGNFLLLIVNVIGILAFMLPFFAQNRQIATETTARAGDGLLLLVVLTVVCLVVMFAQLGAGLNTKTITLLSVLVAINSILRLLDLLMPLPGGFSPMFVLIILVGYAYGAQLGFLLGALSFFCSAIVTGGIGPWLPFQMFTAGWVGLLAGWLPHLQNPRFEKWYLASFGLMIGFFYGIVINLYSWPFLAGEIQQTWQAGLSVEQGIERYLLFYGITSLWWDVFGAVGNFVLLMVLGTALLQALRRFQARFFPEISQ